MTLAVALVWAAALTSLSPVSKAVAQPPELPAAVATHSVDPSVLLPYDLDFTLPTAAKAGCGVCHGDPDLARVKDNEVVSYFVDPDVMESSAHAGTSCSGCHLNFAFTVPHVGPGVDWRTEAKSSCKNCHGEQSVDYGRGVHGSNLDDDEITLVTASGEAVERPLCGDCHDGHATPTLTDDDEGQALLHDRGWELCGRCHEEYWDNYADYYHGAAYKRGAIDAPACWDCHGGHEILPSTNVDSMVNERHLAETCGACHSDVSAGYLAYAKLVHTREQRTAENPLVGIWRGIVDFVGSLLRLG